MNKLIGFALLICMAGFVIASGCSDSNNQPTGTDNHQPELAFSAHQSECLPGTSTARRSLESGVLATASDLQLIISCDTLKLDHNAVVANCGAIFDIQVTVDDSLITFTEIDTSMQHMHCMCEFDLDASISGLANGWYYVHVWGNKSLFNPESELELLYQGQVTIDCSGQ